jgi:peroxiredoxin family protein
MPSEPLGIILLSGSHDRAQFAFSLAAAAAALGRPVILFASNQGIRALLKDWRTQENAHGDATLRAASLELGVRLFACETALQAAAIGEEDLLPEAEITGLASFLHETGTGQLISI